VVEEKNNTKKQRKPLILTLYQEGTMPENLNQFFERLGEVLIGILNFLPTLILALILLLLGWLLAKLIRLLVIRLLNIFKFDRLIKKGPQDELRERDRVKAKELIGNLFYWFLIFVLLIVVLDVLGLNIGGLVLNRILEILPGIFVAIMILILGLVLAIFAGEIAHALLLNTKIKHPLIWVRGIRWLTLAFVVVLALEQLGLAAHLVINLILILAGAIALSLALAFGLGCKDIAKDIIIEFFKKEEEEK
jgi:MFS family permease